MTVFDGFFSADASLFEVKIEADGNDITDYSSHHDQSSIGMKFSCSTLCIHLLCVGYSNCRIDEPMLLLLYSHFENF